ncbi:hypothetical protein M426DRAFT_79811 [Hypoxylon sp. CI-4A]|nr:hypothetical protein M426DRAFT_79811 [Hypoxylon sp. CI-4A]
MMNDGTATCRWMGDYPSTRPEGMNVWSPRNIGSRKESMDLLGGGRPFFVYTHQGYNNPETAMVHATVPRLISMASCQCPCRKQGNFIPRFY